MSYYSTICLLPSHSKKITWYRMMFPEVDMLCHRRLLNFFVNVQSEDVNVNINLCKCKIEAISKTLKVKVTK